MAHSLLSPPVQTPRKTTNTSFASVLTLASWRLRRTWLLLLMVTLGMITAVIVSCAVPLFFPITTTAGLRGMLREQPGNAQISSNISTLGLSTRVAQAVQQQVNPLFQQSLGNYLAPHPQFFINSSNIDSSSPAIRGQHVLHVISTSMPDAASHITLVEGRLPHRTSNPSGDVEIMMTPSTAQSFHLHIGSSMKLNFPFYTQIPDPFDFNPSTSITAQFNAHLVGLFTVNNNNLAYWQGQNFESYEIRQAVSAVARIDITHYFLLLPSEDILGVYDGLSTRYHIETPFAVGGNTLTWNYSLDTTHITAPQLNTLIQRVAALKSSFDVRYVGAQGYYGYAYDPNNPPPFPYVYQVTLLSPLISLPGTPSTLEQYQGRVAATNVPTFLIAVQILGLILFFVSLMTDVLVERQADTIAILRSRGASRGQVFGALFTQSIGLCLLAVLVGVPLALLVVLFIAGHLLPPTIQDSLNVVSAQPLRSALSTLSYAAVVVLVILLTMSFSLARAARMDVLSIRRSASRLSRPPLWQRLRVDVVAGVLALLGYLISLYLSTVGTGLSSTAQSLVVVPLSLIAPLFLVIGALLLSLRLLPLLLRFGARLAVQSRSATSMLALAQMARLPQQAIRMTLLLALATGFTLFALVFSASQEQRIQDLAAYQAGADFSGTIPINTPQLSIQTWTETYHTLPGVTSASVGYVAPAVPNSQGTGVHLVVQGIDSTTFAQTALWPSTSASQSLPSLMHLLVSQRQEGINSGVAPVIVDNVVSSHLGLHVGSTLHVTVEDDSLLINDLSCRVIAIVQAIPTPGALNGSTGNTSATGSILLDYQTYDSIYMQNAQSLVGKGHTGLLPNYIWLRTRDDATTVNQIRVTLKRGIYVLTNLQDRRAIIDQQHSDPLTVALLGMLGLGIVVTLLLAILGDILTSWLSARTRLTNFVVLRALGTSPRQVASVLGWEQALVYSVGLLLGLAFGLLLAITIVPTLITHNTGGLDVLPAHIVLPTTLIIALLGVAAIFILALGMMVYMVSRPSMSQTLRLNED